MPAAAAVLHARPFVSYSSKNVQVNSRCTDACDRLGDAYELRSDRSLTIRQYQRALRIDPNLAHSTKALSRLAKG